MCQCQVPTVVEDRYTSSIRGIDARDKKVKLFVMMIVNLLALLGSIRASSASFSGGMDFFTPSMITIPESPSNDVVEDPSIELLCLWRFTFLSPIFSSPAPENPNPSKKSESTDKLRRCPTDWRADVDFPLDSSESTLIGTAPETGDGRGRLEMSKSEGSKRRMSSKVAAKRKEVSEWDLRWWDPRSGIRSRSIIVGGFPMNLLGSIKKSKKTLEVYFWNIWVYDFFFLVCVVIKECLFFIFF